ncbi:MULTISPECIES: hypothetical protein [Mesorhizobium]|uniref:hypothetical protein n=1 Tax=Mesorhizobium TaxID=68287 RepID=UPI00131558BE|nr:MULTISPECIES: hypothetical protein [Mesorhizobium]
MERWGAEANAGATIGPVIMKKTYVKPTLTPQPGAQPTIRIDCYPSNLVEKT